MLTNVEHQNLRERKAEPTYGLSYLTQILLGKSKCLLLILPSLELSDELKVYLSFRRRSLVLFCESSHSLVRQYCQRNHGPATPSPICLMTLDVLRAVDGWKLVSNRLRHAESNFPTINETDIREFMEIRIQNAGRTTIRELHVACTEVASYAIKNRLQAIGLNDFAYYYLRAGGV